MRNGFRDALLAMWILGLVITVGAIILTVHAFSSFNPGDGSVPAPQNFVIAYGASTVAVLGVGATFFSLVAWLVVSAIGRDAVTVAAAKG